MNCSLTKNLLRVSISGFVLTVLMVLVSWNVSANGEELFNQCKSCHKASSKRTVGPGLAGVTSKRTEEWLISWVKNSTALIESGDADAIAIFEEYNKIPMQSFPNLSDDDIKSIFAYIDAQNVAAPTANTASVAVEETGLSGDALVADLNKKSGKYHPWYKLAVLVFGLSILYFVRKSKRAKDDLSGLGYEVGKDPRNIITTFLIMGIAACTLVYILFDAYARGNPWLDVALFGAFPYLALVVFLIGSIVRYKMSGFQVSSLSSQFLEGRKLFWGSQPFHWGMLVLFVGHLTAFLVPKAILAWNGSPVRLLILEISSFAFALLALFGLLIFIKRRFSSRKLLVVSNNMDMVVYMVLLVQILSGIGVALFARWGSSWFAGVISPYLSSVFGFDPDVALMTTLGAQDVAAMGAWQAMAVFMVKLHITSAFLIIALIPFTRFVHFLVAPIDYIWRRYQYVIWNWDRKAIRKSTRHTFGHRPKNN